MRISGAIYPVWTAAFSLSTSHPHPPWFLLQTAPNCALRPEGDSSFLSVILRPEWNRARPRASVVREKPLPSQERPAAGTGLIPEGSTLLSDCFRVMGACLFSGSHSAFSYEPATFYITPSPICPWPLSSELQPGLSRAAGAQC